MAQGEVKRAAKYSKLLVLAVAVALAAALLAAMTQLDQRYSATRFEYGLSVNSAELNEAELDRTLDMAKAAGVDTISAGAVWWHLSTGEGTYDWGYLDHLVSAAEKRGMKVSLQLHGTPDWVHPSLKRSVSNFEERIWHPPRGSIELDHWSNFVNDVVSRYKGRVVRYEMWNEPNLPEFWKPSPNPSEYTVLLRAGYLSAKSADPDATVVFGGLSRNDVGYLNTYYSEAKRYSDAASENYFFDVLDVHPYSSIPASGSGLEEPISPDRETCRAVFKGDYGEIDQTFLGIEKTKSVMDKQEGDTGKNIYLGEYGFSTTDTWMKAVPEYRRALYLKRAYAQAQGLPYLTGMNWFAYVPTSSSGSEWAIVDADLNETMTFRALRQLNGAEQGGASVTLSAPSTASISGTYSISPSTTNLGPTSNWELYVDGELQGVYGQVPIDWDTTSVPDGTYTVIVAAYTQEGSVWPSNAISLTINNGAAPVTVDSLTQALGTAYCWFGGTG
jgi:hypothetical protein